jgi:transaldolase
VAEARGLWWLVDRPNMFVKIPSTVEGLPAIATCIAEGISINVTLLFSIDRYRAVMDAYQSGLEQAAGRGLDLRTIHSVASFFVSRVDTEVDPRLEKIGTPEALALRGKAALANARLAYEAYEEVIAADRWQALAAKGARVQRPLWASTGVKNPEYEDTRYVDGLIAPDTVNTVPEKTLDAVADHGHVEADTIRPAYGEAHRTVAELAAVGIDLHEVTHLLEVEGVDKFETAWASTMQSLESALEQARGRSTGTGAA